MDKLIVGMHVEIMRSDGRVHGAIITELKHPTKSISVEWFEKVHNIGILFCINNYEFLFFYRVKLKERN
jgi:hypothetical protein